MRTVTFSLTETAIDPIEPQYGGIQGDHNATQVVFSLPQPWVTADYALRAEFVDGAGAFDTTAFLERSGETVTVPLPGAWTAAGGLAEIRLAAAVPAAPGLPEEIVAYSPVGYLYFDSRTGEPAAWREFPNRGLSALIADAYAAIAHMDGMTEDLQERLQNGEFDGATWRFGTAVSGTTAQVTATVPGAKVGDLYLNTATDYVYALTAADTWQTIGCIRGDTGERGPAGRDGYGVLPVQNLATSTTGTGDHIYEVAVGGEYEELPPAFMIGFYMSYGMTAADRIRIYGSGMLWEGTNKNVVGVPLSPGYHLFEYDNGTMYEVFGSALKTASEAAGTANAAAAELLRRAEAGEFNGEKGDKGDPGEKGEPGDLVAGFGVLDCGIWDGDASALAAHNLLSTAHEDLILDGNDEGDDPVTPDDLAAHNTDPYAHRNLQVDGGNINQF